jgi:hypothetical protein
MIPSQPTRSARTQVRLKSNADDTARSLPVRRPEAATRIRTSRTVVRADRRRQTGRETVRRDSP